MFIRTIPIKYDVRGIMVLNTTFNNISVTFISWRTN